MRLGRYLESFNTPQPLYPLTVDEPVFFFELGGDTTVAVAGVQLGEFMETLDQFFVLLRALKPVLLRAPRLAEHPTDLPFTDPQLAPDMLYGVPAGAGR
jgi:hypothetical protein